MTQTNAKVRDKELDELVFRAVLRFWIPFMSAAKFDVRRVAVALRKCRALRCVTPLLDKVAARVGLTQDTLNALFLSHGQVHNEIPRAETV